MLSIHQVTGQSVFLHTYLEVAGQSAFLHSLLTYLKGTSRYEIIVDNTQRYVL